MTKDSGIRVERHRSALQKELKVDLRSLLGALGKAAVNGAFLQWNDLAENGVEVLESLGLESTPGEIAGLLIVRSLMQGMQNLTQEYAASLREKPDNLRNLYTQLNNSIATQELIINSDFFDRPEQLSLVREAKAAFTQWLKTWVEHPLDAEKISSSFTAYYVEALNDQWLNRDREYSVIREILDTPFTQANKREQQWLHYRAWLQKQIEKPMFAEAFSLKQVYVPLRAYYEQRSKDKEKETREQYSDINYKNDRIVIQLQESLDKWLQEANKDDAIRLISGGPGSGKSSFSKIFAARQAERGDIPVLFIPLHKFGHGDDLVKAVGDFAQINCFLSDNPIERDNQDLRLLIIFDGLDELSMQGKIAENAAKDFVEAVRLLVMQFNSHQTRLQVIISGRDVVMQANRNQRQSHQLLYLLPYFVTEKERQQNNYKDLDNLLVADQRTDWWQNYGLAKGKQYTDLPTELDRNNLVDITAQPLLNYLIALTYERDNIEFTDNTNLNEIYGDLLEAVYDRSYEKHGYLPLQDISLKEFIAILEEVALACWHGNGRTATVREIENYCDREGLTQILHRFQDSFERDSQACITRLLAAFYFRESDGIRGQEKTFEFTHKSFREYLTARRIVEEIKNIFEDLETKKSNFRKGCNETDALVRWANLCGFAPMDEYLFSFICDEIKLIYAENFELVRNWQKMLCRLIEEIMANGMPMEKLDPRPNFQEEMRRSRNAEEALLAVLNACARVTQEISDIAWPSPEAFGTWIARLRGQRTRHKNVLALQCLSWLNLKKCILIGSDLHEANLVRANLENASLWEANLRGANLENANFRSADLDGINLKSANLKSANLKSANLRNTQLAQSNLENANFESANLEEANLWLSYLYTTNLQEANLHGAYLRGANLRGANFQRTNLRGTKFVDGNLLGAKLEGAKLEGAYLGGAYLGGTILEGKDIAEITRIKDNE